MKRSSAIPGMRTTGTLIGLLCLIPSSAQAANECQVKYTYAPSMGQTSTATVNLDAGETKNINRSNVLYVQNVKNHKVRVFRSGFGSYVELTQNGRDPGMGNYLGNVILQKVQCMTSSGSGSSGPTYQTPAAMINALKATGTSIAQLTTQVAAVFNVSAQQMAELLKAAGYDATQVAAGLASAFNANAAQAGQWLEAAGFSAVQIAQALKAQFNATVNVFLSTQVCGAAGCPSQQVALALKNVFNTSQSQLAGLMKGAGYTHNQIADALRNAYSANGQQIAALLKAAQYDAGQVAAALESVFSSLSAGQTAQWLQQAGFSIAQVASALRSQHNQSATQAAALLKTAFNAADSAIQKALQAAGYTAAQIAEAFKPEMNIGAVVVLGKSYGSQSSNGQVVPLYKFQSRITYVAMGEGLHVANAVTGLPPGATYTLSGQQPSRVNIDIMLPSSSTIGSTGMATVMGAGATARFAWRVTEMPRTTSAPPPSRGGAPASGTSLPDLQPATFTNNLYKVGSATTMDAAGDTFTALDPFNSSPFCQGIPEGTTTRNNMSTSNRRQVTVPDVRWGVRNSSSVAVSTPFNVKLLRGGSVVASERVTSLAAGQIVSFEYRRPQSITTVARVGQGAGCYHVGLRTQGWNDNLSFQVRVDTETEVSESSESNNSR